MRLLKNERIKEGSIIIFSDADEIPSKKSIKTLKSLFDNQYHEKFYVFEQNWYWLSLKYKFKNKWLGSIGFKFSENSNIDLEAERRLRVFRKKIKGGGKHLSYFLDEGEILNKLNSFAHCNDSRNKFFKNNFIDYIRLLSCNCMTSPFSKNRVLIQKEEILKKSFMIVAFLKIKLFGYDSIWVLLKIMHKIKINYLDNLKKLIF